MALLTDEESAQFAQAATAVPLAQGVVAADHFTIDENLRKGAHAAAVHHGISGSIVPDAVDAVGNLQGA